MFYLCIWEIFTTVGHCLGFKSNNIVDVISQTIGGRAYPVRHYPIAIRLRDRKGRAILCVVLIPQSGDSSGTTLGVRSVALLHALCNQLVIRICAFFVYFECTSHNKLRVPPRSYVLSMQPILQFARNYLQKWFALCHPLSTTSLPS